MANNYLITGYWGEPHVTAENDRGIHAGIVGAGRFVLPVGNQFRAEYIGNNTIRVYDGKLMDNGAAAGIPAGEYIDLLIANAGQGMKRNDMIVFQYVKDASTLIETGTFIVVQGTEGSSAADPELEQEDLLSGNAFKDQFPLWRVPVEGANISAPVKMFEVSQDISNLKPPAVNYSTAEVKTEDTWIDGKPIYMRTFTGNSGADKTGKAIGHIPDLDMVVDFRGSVTVADYNLIEPIPSYRASTNTLWHGIYVMTTTKNVSVASSFSEGAFFRVTVYYTKTTD